jgi:hypothetical protein
MRAVPEPVSRQYHLFESFIIQVQVAEVVGNLSLMELLPSPLGVLVPRLTKRKSTYQGMLQFGCIQVAFRLHVALLQMSSTAHNTITVMISSSSIFGCGSAGGGMSTSVAER